MTYFKSESPKKMFSLFLLLILILSTGCKDGNLFKEDPSVAAKAIDDMSNQASFYADSFTATTASETLFDELGKPNARSYQFSACIKDVSQRGVLIRQHWWLGDGKTEKEMVADQAGCIFWPETLHFDYWAPESYVEMDRTLRADVGQIGAIKLKIFINPWKNDFVYHPFNARQVPAQYLVRDANGSAAFNGKLEPMANDNKIEKVRTTTADIKLQFNGQALKSYEIDQNLSLTVAHKYFIQLTPAIRRRTISDPNKAEPPTQGTVNLLLMFFKDDGDIRNPYTAENYISQFQGDIEIDKDFGRAGNEVVFKFPDIVHLSSRMRVLARLEYRLVNPSPYLDRPAFTGFIEGLPGSSITLSEKINAEIVDEIAQQVKNYNQKYNSVNGFDAFKQQKGMTELIDSDFASSTMPTRNNFNAFWSPLPKESLLRLIENKATSDDLRRLQFSMTKKISEIYKVPTLTLRHSTLFMSEVKTVDFVDKINNPTPVIAFEEKAESSIPGTLAISFSQNESQTVKWDAGGGLSAGLNANAGLGLDFLKFFNFPVPDSKTGQKTELGIGASLKASISGGWSYGWSRETKSGVAYTKTLSLTSRKRSFLVDAMVKHCLVVGFQSNPLFGDLLHKELSEKGPFSFIYCEPQTQRRILKEAFYYVSDNVNTTDPWVDSKSFQERIFLAFIRGEREYDLLRDLWVHRKAGFTFFSYNPFDHSQTAVPRGLIERVTQQFPGMVSGFPKYESELLKRPNLNYEMMDSK